MYLKRFIAILRDDKEIEEMRDDIIKITKATAAHATQYVTKFHPYQYLWTTDRDKYLKQFLVYGRGLTYDEEQMLGTPDENKLKENKPTLDVFRAQVCSFDYNSILKFSSWDYILADGKVSSTSRRSESHGRKC